jgi:hypothetical protein
VRADPVSGHLGDLVRRDEEPPGFDARYCFDAVGSRLG